MNELEKQLTKEKTKILTEICEQIDNLYYYAKELISKEITHDLGFRKEKLKEFIEQKIKSL